MTSHYGKIETPVGPAYLVLKGRELAEVSIWREPRGIRRPRRIFAKPEDGFWTWNIIIPSIPLADRYRTQPAR